MDKPPSNARTTHHHGLVAHADVSVMVRGHKAHERLCDFGRQAQGRLVQAHRDSPLMMWVQSCAEGA